MKLVCCRTRKASIGGPSSLVCKMSNFSSQSQALSFGFSWPDLNDGLLYYDVVRPSDSGPPLFVSFSFQALFSTLTFICLVAAKV